MSIESKWCFRLFFAGDVTAIVVAREFIRIYVVITYAIDSFAVER